MEGGGLRTMSGQSVMKRSEGLAQRERPGTLTSSRKGLGREVLLSRATATLEAVQYRRNQAHLWVSAQQGKVSSSRSQARATKTWTKC